MANRTIILKDMEIFKNIITKEGFSYRQLAKRSGLFTNSN